MLPAPDAFRHDRLVDAAKAFEALPVPFRPQKRKAAFRADWSVLGTGMLRQIILCITAGTDQVG